MYSYIDLKNAIIAPTPHKLKAVGDDYKNFFTKLIINRQVKHYKQTLLWCKIFLLGNSFTPHKGDDLALALLFDMNALFESYVGNFIKKKHPGSCWNFS